MPSAGRPVEETKPKTGYPAADKQVPARRWGPLEMEDGTLITLRQPPAKDSKAGGCEVCVVVEAALVIHRLDNIHFVLHTGYKYEAHKGAGNVASVKFQISCGALAVERGSGKNFGFILCFHSVSPAPPV